MQLFVYFNFKTDKILKTEQSYRQVFEWKYGANVAFFSDIGKFLGQNERKNRKNNLYGWNINVSINVQINVL